MEYENIRARVLTGHEGGFSDIMEKLNGSISEIREKLKERGRRGKDASIESMKDKTVATIVLSLCYYLINQTARAGTTS